MNNGRKRVYYKPSKASGLVGGVIGGIFVLIGIFFAIPVFGAFGVLWTLVAAVITCVSLYQAFGKTSGGGAVFGSELYVEDLPNDGESVETRLNKLLDLYDRRIITREEYEDKRREILREL